MYVSTGKIIFILHQETLIFDLLMLPISVQLELLQTIRQKSQVTESPLCPVLM